MSIAFASMGLPPEERNNARLVKALLTAEAACASARQSAWWVNNVPDREWTARDFAAHLETARAAIAAAIAESKKEMPR